MRICEHLGKVPRRAPGLRLYTARMVAPVASAVPADRRRTALIILTATGMVAYAAVAVAADRQRLLAALAHLGLLGLAGILGMSLVNYALRFVRWDSYITMLAHRLPRLRHAFYYFSGFTYTVSPGKAGEAMRSIYLKQHGVAYADSIASLFVERLLDLAAIVLISLLIISASGAFLPLLLGSAGVFALVLWLAASGLLPRWLQAWRARMGQGRVAGALGAVAELLESSRRLLRPGPLLYGLALGLIAWSAEGVGFYLICHGLDLHVGVLEATGVYALAVLAGTAVVFLPGGIGGTEIVMATLLTARGASLPEAVIATSLCRLATLWFAVVLGFAATAVLEVGPLRRREVPAA